MTNIVDALESIRDLVDRIGGAVTMVQLVDFMSGTPQNGPERMMARYCLLWYRREMGGLEHR